MWTSLTLFFINLINLLFFYLIFKKLRRNFHSLPTRPSWTINLSSIVKLSSINFPCESWLRPTDSLSLIQSQALDASRIFIQQNERRYKSMMTMVDILEEDKQHVMWSISKFSHIWIRVTRIHTRYPWNVERMMMMIINAKSKIRFELISTIMYFINWLRDFTKWFAEASSLLKSVLIRVGHSSTSSSLFSIMEISRVKMDHLSEAHKMQIESIVLLLITLKISNLWNEISLNFLMEVFLFLLFRYSRLKHKVKCRLKVTTKNVDKKLIDFKLLLEEV